MVISLRSRYHFVKGEISKENGSKDEMGLKEGGEVDYQWLCLLFSTEPFKPSIPFIRDLLSGFRSISMQVTRKPEQAIC